MLSWLAQRRRTVSNFSDLLEHGFVMSGSPTIVQVGFFVISAWALIGFRLTRFLLEFPVHLLKYPTTSFELLARRDANQSFLDSYALHLRRYRLAVATLMLSLLMFAGEIYIATRGFQILTEPTETLAVTGSVTLNPIWDRTGYEDIVSDGLCDVLSTTYNCESANATSLKLGWFFTSCGSTEQIYRSAMKFSLSSIPNNATITDVDLIVNVNNTITSTVQIFRPTTDAPDTLSCTDAGSGLYTNLGTSGANYVTASNWNSSGSKTLDLGATADSDIQSRITSSDIIAIGVRVNSPSASIDGAYNSVDNASNKPQLVIAYTTPPLAPLDFASEGETTTTIDWSWTDVASTETRYDVHNSSHTPVTGCTNLAPNSGSCTETGLTANTQYSRHPNVTDPQGNTDGTGASVYTAIETPTGINFGAVTDTSVAVTASGSFSNLTSGSSGLFFQENSTTTNSGWVQTNGWTKGGLSANTQYSFQAKARNGDTDETSLTAASTKYTLASAPNITSSRSTSTTYTTPDFDFTNAAGWGAGGVQYYRYSWDQIASHTFVGSESTWSNSAANCPGGTCTDAGATLTKTATADGDWYLHVQSFNTEDAANGNGTTYGPYVFNAPAPPVPPPTPAPEPEPEPTPAPEPAPATDTPMITNFDDGDTTIERQPVVAGVGPANADIFILTDREINVVVRSTSNGSFSARLQKALSLGVHELVVRARTSSEVSDESDPIEITVIPPGIPVTIRQQLVSDGTSPRIEVEGVAPTNSTVRVYLDGSVLFSFTAAPSPNSAYGFRKTIVFSSSLPVGQHQIWFVAINANGDPSLPNGHIDFTKTAAGEGTIIYGENVTYVVQSGDSLWEIAEMFYGDGTRWDEIRQANVEQFPSLASSTTIHIGWQLIIPAGL